MWWNAIYGWFSGGKSGGLSSAATTIALKRIYILDNCHEIINSNSTVSSVWITFNLQLVHSEPLTVRYFEAPLGSTVAVHVCKTASLIKISAFNDFHKTLRDGKSFQSKNIFQIDVYTSFHTMRVYACFAGYCVWISLNVSKTNAHRILASLPFLNVTQLATCNNMDWVKINAFNPYSTIRISTKTTFMFRVHRYNAHK